MGSTSWSLKLSRSLDKSTSRYARYVVPIRGPSRIGCKSNVSFTSDIRHPNVVFISRQQLTIGLRDPVMMKPTFFKHCRHDIPPEEPTMSLTMVYAVFVLLHIVSSISCKREAYGPICIQWNFIVIIPPSI
ncbi:UNVERIFIED_CONTAM: hypothetical protein RMT77_012346 [Armadillidium vulgare]